VLSLPAGASLRHCPSRFVSNGTAGFWVEAPRGELPLVDNLIRSGLPVGVSFTTGLHKVMFASPLRQQELKRVNLTARVPALLMAYPAETTAVLRRTRESARVAPGSDVRVRVWQIDERAPLEARPKPQAEVPCALLDISTGGLGLTFYGRGGDPPRLARDGRLRVEVSHPGGLLLVEGRVRHLSHAAESNSARGGVEFAAAGRDADPARTQLARIVAGLQRQERRPPRAAACRI
jgi:c-di-GMP-binding flagellar brake protein YcgR